jgi:hypothetical protein
MAIDIDGFANTGGGDPADATYSANNPHSVAQINPF